MGVWGKRKEANESVLNCQTLLPERAKILPERALETPPLKGQKRSSFEVTFKPLIADSQF